MKLSKKAELFVLLALYELDSARWREAINYLRRSRYTDIDIDERDFPSLRFDLIRKGYVETENRNLMLTSAGIKQLRFLAGQLRSDDVTAKGAEQAQKFRAEYDNRIARKRAGHPVSASGKYPSPDPKLLHQQQLLEDAGEGYPYRTLARARRMENGDYNVYVIRLNEAIKEKHPKKVGKDPKLPAVYVGQSYHPPRKRFDQHKNGIHASRHVRKFGLELIPALYTPYNPLPSTEEAMKVEAALAEKLRRLGYTVFGGH